MNVPFTAMHFSVYEAAKKWLLHVDNEEAEERLSVQLVAGGLRFVVDLLICYGLQCCTRI